MSEIRSQATPARDELVHVLAGAVLGNPGGIGTLPQHAAERLLAAGWSKPRTVNSATELDALPIGSAVAVALYPQKWHHGVWVKTDTDEWSSHNWRAKRDNESMAVGPEGAITPATVLFTPGDMG